MHLTRKLAQAASLDAGNRSMRTAHRGTWNEEDLQACAGEFNRLWPTCPHGIEPEEFCSLCEAVSSGQIADPSI